MASMGFMDDLRDIRTRTSKDEYERDWTIYAARLERHSVVEIAEAIGLSRSQVHRILDRVDLQVDNYQVAHPEASKDDAVASAWAWASWDDWHEALGRDLGRDEIVKRSK